MNKSKALGAALITALLICLVAAAAPAENIRVFSGQDLLRLIRQRAGAPKPAYENRLEQPTIPAEPEVVEVPEIPEEPQPPEEPEIPEEFTIIEMPIEPTVSDIDVLVPEPAPIPPPPPTPTPEPEPAGDNLLEMVPAESLFCARINSFDYTLSQIDQFLAGAAPIPVMTSMLVRMQLANILGSPQLPGINMGGNFAIFAPIPSRDVDPESLGILVPVTDYEQFISGNANISKPDKNGISTITAPDMPETLVIQVNNYALIAPEGDEDDLIALAKSISAGRITAMPNALDASEAQRAANQAIWAYVNVELTQKTMGDDIAAALAMLQMMPGTMGPGEQPGMSPAAALAGLDLDKILKQVRFLSLTLNPKPNVLSINYTISAVAGTEMAKTLSADSPAILTLSKMLGAKDPKQTGPQLKSIAALIPNADQADLVGTHNLLDLISKGAALSPMPMPKIDARAKSSVAFAVKVGNGALSVDIALPKEHAVEIAAALMKLQPVVAGQPVPGQPMPPTMMPVGPAPTIPQEALTIQPGVGMGEIRFGTPIEKTVQTFAAFGAVPDSTTAGTATASAIEYHSLGLAIVASNEGTVASILCGDAGRPDSPLIKACRCRTGEGIGMGSGRRDIMKAYRRPSSTRTNDIPGQGRIVVFEYERIGAQFTLRNDKVVHMMFRQSRPATR